MANKKSNKVKPVLKPKTAPQKLKALPKNPKPPKGK
jgi:hypothetical protein